MAEGGVAGGINGDGVEERKGREKNIKSLSRCLSPAMQTGPCALRMEPPASCLTRWPPSLLGRGPTELPGRRGSQWPGAGGAESRGRPHCTQKG